MKKKEVKEEKKNVIKRIKEKEVSHKDRDILILLLCLIIVCLVGYGIYLKMNGRLVEPTNSEELVDKTTEDNSVNSVDFKSLVEKYFIYDVSNPNAKYLVNLSSEDDKFAVLANNAPDDEKIQCTTSDDSEICAEDNQTSFVSYDKMNQKYKELFGSNSKDIPKKNISDLTCNTYSYNSEKNGYILKMYNCGGVSEEEIKTVYGLVDTKSEDNKINLTIVLEDLSSNDGTTYTNKEKTITYTMGESEEEFINNNLDKLTKYTLTFKLENENYYLNSIEKSK